VEQHRKELVTAQASLDTVLAQLENQEMVLKPSLDELEATLERIGVQVKALNIAQELAATDSKLTIDKFDEIKKLQKNISQEISGLWNETNRLRESHDTMSELASGITDDLSKVQIILNRLEVTGQRSETIALLAASSTMTLLATNLHALFKSYQTDSTMRK
jgi:chromosome segregation ATPase